MKICDFGQHFLLVSYMLNFCPFGVKKVSFNRYKIDLSEYEKKLGIHRIAFVLQRVKVGLPFL